MCNIVTRQIYKFNFLELIKFKFGCVFLQTQIIIHKLLIFITYFFTSYATFFHGIMDVF